MGFAIRILMSRGKVNIPLLGNLGSISGSLCVLVGEYGVLHSCSAQETVSAGQSSTCRESRRSESAHNYYILRK
jgi:hypothetical protein